MSKRTRILLVVAGVVVALVTLALAFLHQPHGKRVEGAGGGEVYYRPPVTRAQATKLARFLERQGVFRAGAGKKTTQLLGRRQGGYRLRVVVRGEPEKLAARDVRALRMLAALVAQRVLGGAEIVLQLCNKQLVPERTIEVPKGLGDLGKLLRFAKGELYYRAPISAAQAKRTGELLLERRFFSDKGRSTVQLLVEGDAVRVRFVVARDKVEKAPTVIGGFRALVRELRLRVFPQQPALLSLCDQAMDCFVEDKRGE